MFRFIQRGDLEIFESDDFGNIKRLRGRIFW